MSNYILRYSVGCMYYGKSRYGHNRGPSRHEAFITEAELIIRALNMGVDGFLKWVFLFDTGESRGHYQLLDFTDGLYRRKGSFYGYGALCRYFPRGAKILRTTVKETSGASLHAVVVISADSAVMTIMLVNDHPSDMLDVHIGGPIGNKAFRKWTIDTWRQSADAVECRQTEDGTLVVRVTPLSLTVLTNAGESPLCKQGK